MEKSCKRNEQDEGENAEDKLRRQVTHWGVNRNESGRLALEPGGPLFFGEAPRL